MLQDIIVPLKNRPASPNTRRTFYPLPFGEGIKGKGFNINTMFDYIQNIRSHHTVPCTTEILHTVMRSTIVGCCGAR